MLRRQGEDPRALKSEQRQTIQRTGAVTFQKAADEWLASNSSKLAATTLKDYKSEGYYRSIKGFPENFLPWVRTLRALRNQGGRSALWPFWACSRGANTRTIAGAIARRRALPSEWLG